MKKTKVIIIGLALSLSALTSPAQNASGGPTRDGGLNGPQLNRPILPPPAAVFDTDADGILSAAEIANAAAILSSLDKNGDHQITLDELCPYGRPGRRGLGREGAPVGLPPCLAGLDPDGDGAISTQETAGASTALKQLDKNNDGQLTADELRLGRGPRGPGSRGPGWGCCGGCGWNATAAGGPNPPPRRRGGNRW